MIVRRIAGETMVSRKADLSLVRRVPSSTTFRQVVAAQSIGSGPDSVPSGASGIALHVSNDEIEVDFYSPKHLIASATLAQLHLE